MKLSAIKPNPENPRVIRDANFKKLKSSLERTPEFMEFEPFIVDENNVLLSGNMRLRALQDLGYKEIPDKWVMNASQLKKVQQEQLVVIKNSHHGEHDMDMLANQYDEEFLREANVINYETEAEEPKKSKPFIKVTFEDEAQALEAENEIAAISDKYGAKFKLKV